MCLVCDECFEPTELRMDYRSKVSNSLGDQKRIRTRCIKGIPIATRDRDILKAWIKKPDLQPDDRSIMKDALRLLKE